LGRRGTRLPDRAAVNPHQSILAPKNSALTQEVFRDGIALSRALLAGDTPPSGSRGNRLSTRQRYRR
jgi:hypothetical protein